MKILFVCENYLPHYGGAEVVFKNLAEGYVKRGHEVNLVTHKLKGTKKKETINGVKVHRVNSFYSRYLFSFLSLPKVIKLAKKADIIQTTTFNGAPPAWAAAKLRKKPVVITVHEVWQKKWKEITGFTAWKCWLHEFMEQLIYLLPYDKYVCVSESTKLDLLKIKNIPHQKVVRIYNGLEYEFWNLGQFKKENSYKIRTQLGLENNFICFSWGRPGASKGFEYLIKAFPKIKLNIPSAKLVLMFGSVDKYKLQYQKLRNLIKILKLNSEVKIIPSQPYEKLGDYILAADCAVIPSLAEGFGYTALEALSLKKPVVVSNAGSLPEVVSGRYQIFRNKDSNDLAEKIVKVFKKEFMESKEKRFEWGKSVEEYLRVYGEVKNTKISPFLKEV